MRVFQGALFSLAAIFIASSAGAQVIPGCTIGSALRGNVPCYSYPNIYSVFSGYGARAMGSYSTAVGVDAWAYTEFSTAVGAASTAAGAISTAVGPYATASGDNSVALGNNSVSTGLGSVALGSNSSATASNSVAIGEGSVADQANTVSVGSTGSERRITNVAAGVNAADAVNMAQLGAVTTSVTGLQSAMSALNANVASVDQRLDQLFSARSTDQREMRSGVASAVAIANAPMPSAPGRTSYIMNAATFRGQQAVGVSMMHRFNTSSPLALGAGISYAGGKNTAGRLSVAGEF